MGEIAADAAAAVERAMRAHGGVGVGIAELDVVVHVIDDGLHQRPALRGRAEGRPGEFREAVSLAVAAAE
jgi:hypothetical protein